MKLSIALRYPVALATFVSLVALVQPVVLAKSATEMSQVGEAILGDSSLLQDEMELYVSEFSVPTGVTTKSLLVFREGRALNSNRVLSLQERSTIALKSDDALTYFNRGLQKHYNLNDFQGALADYNRAIALKPDYAEVYNSRGILKYYKLNDRQGALADYSRAITLNPDYAFAYNNRGILKKNKLNDIQGAIADFRQAAKLDRQHGKSQYLQDSIDQLRSLGATE